MSNKTNIEEDIKIANAIVKVNKDYLKDVENQTINQREIQAIENILADRERLEKIIKSMSEEITHKQDEYCKHYCNALREYGQLQAKANKYDSLVEKIKKKMEELDKEITRIEQMNASATKYDTIQKLDNQINILQELLDTEKQ